MCALRESWDKSAEVVQCTQETLECLPRFRAFPFQHVHYTLDVGCVSSWVENDSEERYAGHKEVALLLVDGERSCSKRV